MTEDKEKHYQCTMSTDEMTEKTLQEYERRGITSPSRQEINRYIAEVRNARYPEKQRIGANKDIVFPSDFDEIDYMQELIRPGNPSGKCTIEESSDTDPHAALTDCVINVVFDHESGAWVATNDDLPITLEDASLDRLVNRLKIVVPEIAECNRIKTLANISCVVELQLDT